MYLIKRNTVQETYKYLIISQLKMPFWIMYYFIYKLKTYTPFIKTCISPQI